MSHDALFQLGMGPVLLDASQKEETFVARVLKACAEAICAGGPSHRFALAVAGRFHADMKRRGNSAKALILRAGSAGVPSKS